MARLFVATIFLCLFAFPAQAHPCWIIRKAVATYGEAAVADYAKSRWKWSDQKIEEHRRKCLKQ